MVLKQKLYSIALVSAAMVLMLVSIAGAEILVDNPNYCEHCAGQTIAYTFNVTNSGNLNITAPITVTTIKVGTTNFSSPCSGIASASDFINVTKVTPTISWSNLADIVYGTPLNSTQLDASASVPGTFVYTPPSGTVLEVGSNQQLATTFTPNDIANYTTATDSVSINVSNVTQATPTISWNPSEVHYGIPLSNDQLNASASDPVYRATLSGTFVYTPPSGTVLEVGSNQQLATTFTPNDIANYTTASTSVSIDVLNVTRETSTIAWNNLADITYGTPLDNTQLDASALNAVSGIKMLGTFVYTPSSGTVLEVGLNQQLTTTFTPNDIANYTTATDSVEINVTKVTPTFTWIPNPRADIVSGTVLGDYLDATATYNGQTVPGNFVYTNETGTIDTAQTVLSVGTHKLTATFAPTDTAAYTSGVIVQNSITVTPTVPSASLSISKSADPTTYDHVGQIITYTYKVTNNGNVAISAPITVTDDKFGTISLQSSGTLNPGSSIIGIATHKTINADINNIYVTNLAYAIGSFNNQPIVSPQTIALVRYEHPTNDRNGNGGSENGDYGSVVVPVVPVSSVLMMSGSPLYSSEPYGYSSEPYGTREAQKSDYNVHKAKAHLSKHKNKHKNHSKHHKTGKSLSIKVDKK